MSDPEARPDYQATVDGVEVTITSRVETDDPADWQDQAPAAWVKKLKDRETGPDGYLPPPEPI